MASFWRSSFSKAVLASALLLIPLTGAQRHLPKPGPPPTRGEEVGEDEGGNKERLLEWIESRHRARPGVDWHAIESANLQASFAYAAAMEKAARKPVWRERGPVNTTGATSRAVLAPDGKTLLVGTSQGGVFSGIPGSQTWRLATDTLNGYLYGFLVTNPKPETWVAAVTGLTDGRVYVSRNKGKTWTAPKGLPSFYYVFEMAQDGGNPKVVYVLGEVLRENDTAAPVLARSRDGGLSFSVVYTGDDYDRPGIWTSRVASGLLYLMTHGRLLVSTDQGSSFSQLGAPAESTSNYHLLRGSEAGAPTLYAAVGRGVYPDTLYVSEDGGASWQSRFKFTGAYPFARVYGGSLAASIRDPNLVLYGAANGYRSTDGGRTFQVINQWYDYYDRPSDRLHADLNGIQFVIDHGEEKLFLSTDGGTYLSLDGGASVENLTLGLPNAQFYSTWSSDTDPDLFLVGSQDQGLQLSLPGEGGRGGRPMATDQLISGDYSGLTSATHDLRNLFVLYPTSEVAAGQLMLFNLVDGSPRLVGGQQPKMSRVGFFAASAADPEDPSIVYIAGDHIWKMRYEGGNSFEQNQLRQDFSFDKRDFVTALAIAPSNPSVWYAATDEGHLWFSRDRGATWTESDTTRGQTPDSASSALLVSADDPFTCYVGGSGYGTSPVLVTHDGGATWSDFSKGLPATTVWALAFDSPTRQTLYAATETGPFAFDAASRSWRSLLGGGAPIGRYFSVEGVPSAGLVRFGTFSRGVWDYVPAARRSR